jgi:light-regulated signal transduction histidine kinase (bacteriophytochrome)
MIELVWRNLLSNAVKYSSRVETPAVSIGSLPGPAPDEVVYYVRHNGIVRSTTNALSIVELVGGPD